MFDEEGRKIDLGFQVGMSLEGMSVAQLEDYACRLKLEIDRVYFEMEKLKAHKKAAESLFKMKDAE